MKSPFEVSAQAAQDRGDRATARLIRTEGRIATALVTAALSRGYVLSINDGEEWTVKRSTDKATIIGALFSTDEDIIRLHDDTGERHGSFFLVYGNDGYDVVSDYSTTEACESINSEVLKPLTDKLECGA